MNGRRCYDLRIADISIRMETDAPMKVEDAFVPFLIREDKPQVTAVFCHVGALPPIPAQVLYEDVCYRVHPDGAGGYLRSFFDAPRDRDPYGVGIYDYPNGKIRVEYLDKGARCVSGMVTGVFHLGIEEIMLTHGRMFLHAACVQTHLGGILFSGPSGIGKSTQAGLWCAHRDGRLINGDRTILSREGETYRAWGSPYAGSSRCHVNDSAPVRAIVMLRQAAECSLRRLEPGEAFRNLYAGAAVSRWDRTSVLRSCDFLGELARQVPVVEFSCTPDAHAVDFLENALQGVI